ncbi:hypothetical protein GCM10022255_044410 [Dactylosporangium darangshiense]|uniref:Uncharacterized protein n=1 Tax=Dactylosporangium darangshiense TaxID=579108 RepID=A0ABP8DAU5_9ACTN
MQPVGAAQRVVVTQRLVAVQRLGGRLTPGAGGSGWSSGKAWAVVAYRAGITMLDGRTFVEGCQECGARPASGRGLGLGLGSMAVETVLLASIEGYKLSQTVKSVN